MKGLKTRIGRSRRQAYTGIADRNRQTIAWYRSRSDCQLATGAFHGLNRVEDQVHEDLLKLYAVRKDLCGMGLYGLSIRFHTQQIGHLLNYFLNVDELALCGCSRLIERSQTVDNVRCASGVLFDPGRCCACSFN